MKSAEIIYQEANRVLDQQERQLDELRSRASGFLGIAALVTTLFAAFDVTSGEATLLSWIGGLFFFGCAFCSCMILWPIPGWYFKHDISDLVADHVDGDEDLLTLLRNLALWTDGKQEKNKKQMDTLYRYFSVAVAFLILEVVAWTIELWIVG